MPAVSRGKTTYLVVSTAALPSTPVRALNSSRGIREYAGSLYGAIMWLFDGGIIPAWFVEAMYHWNGAKLASCSSGLAPLATGSAWVLTPPEMFLPGCKVKPVVPPPEKGRVAIPAGNTSRTAFMSLWGQHV